jgi:hypothetical protein
MKKVSAVCGLLVLVAFALGFGVSTADAPSALPVSPGFSIEAAGSPLPPPIPPELQADGSPLPPPIPPAFEAAES